MPDDWQKYSFEAVCNKLINHACEIIISGRTIKLRFNNSFVYKAVLEDIMDRIRTIVNLKSTLIRYFKVK